MFFFSGPFPPFSNAPYAPFCRQSRVPAVSAYLVLRRRSCARLQALRAAPAPLRRRCTPPRAGVPTRTRRWRAGQRRRAAPTNGRPTPHALPPGELVAASAPNRPPTSTPPSGSGERARTRGRSGGVCVGRRNPQPDRDVSARVTGLTMVTSTACCAQRQRVRDDFDAAVIRGHRCSCQPGERCGRPSPRLHGTPTARSRGGARDASTPEVAHAALWSPRGSRRPRQAHARARCDWQRQAKPS